MCNLWGSFQSVSSQARVAAAIAAMPLGPGDIAMLNDPYAGGTHLPDITLVMPVFEEQGAAQKRRRRKPPLF